MATRLHANRAGLVALRRQIDRAVVSHQRAGHAVAKRGHGPARARIWKPRHGSVTVGARKKGSDRGMGVFDR